MRCSAGMTLLKMSMSRLWRKAYPTPSFTLWKNSPGAAPAGWSSSTDTLGDSPLQPSGNKNKNNNPTLSQTYRQTRSIARTKRTPHDLFFRTAFCCWMLANILFALPVVLYAGYMTMATAAFIFFSVASFSTIMNVHQCVFSLGEDSFVTEYSYSFWLALATGEHFLVHIQCLCTAPSIITGTLW